jgi:peroxiredoxin
VNDRSAEDTLPWVERESLPFRVLIDPDRSIGLAYEISQPTAEKYVANNAEGRRPAILIDEQGQVELILPDIRNVEDQVAALKTLG